MSEDEIIEEIAAVKTAISAIRNGGQSYTIDTGSSVRTVTMANYESLKSELKELYRQLATENGSGGSLSLGVGW